MHSSVIFIFRCNLQCNKEQRNQIKITKQWITHYFEYISIYLPTVNLSRNLLRRFIYPLFNVKCSSESMLIRLKSKLVTSSSTRVSYFKKIYRAVLMIFAKALKFKNYHKIITRMILEKHVVLEISNTSFNKTF